MKICLMIKDFAVGKKFLADGRPTKSGAEIHAENHALQLIKLGHCVTLMTKKRFFFLYSNDCQKIVVPLQPKLTNNE